MKAYVWVYVLEPCLLKRETLRCPSCQSLKRVQRQRQCHFFREALSQRLCHCSKEALKQRHCLSCKKVQRQARCQNLNKVLKKARRLYFEETLVLSPRLCSSFIKDSLCLALRARIISCTRGYLLLFYCKSFPTTTVIQLSLWENRNRWAKYHSPGLPQTRSPLIPPSRQMMTAKDVACTR